MAVKDFSRGMKVKLMFASVLARDTKLLVLDLLSFSFPNVMDHDLINGRLLKMKFIRQKIRPVTGKDRLKSVGIVHNPDQRPLQFRIDRTPFSFHQQMTLQQLILRIIEDRLSLMNKINVKVSMKALYFAKIDYIKTRTQWYMMLSISVIVIVIMMLNSSSMVGQVNFMYGVFIAIVFSTNPFGACTRKDMGFQQLLPATTFQRVAGRFLFNLFLQNIKLSWIPPFLCCFYQSYFFL